MIDKPTTVEAYLAGLPPERKPHVEKLLNVVKSNLPDGFEIGMSYGMIGICVPHRLYPAGYHCNPQQPLPFAGLANQKGAISFYHMGIYMDDDLMEWFKKEYASRVPGKLDMGKSCIRFKKPEQIPYELMGELMKKWSVDDWISRYEKVLKK